MKCRVYSLILLLFVCVLTLAIIYNNDKQISFLSKFQNNQKYGYNKIKSYYFTNQDNCVLKNVTLSKTPLPLTGLVSFPGSGNTWARHLIQQMTGLATSSVYCDRKLREKGFPYECSSEKRNRTIVIKTHTVEHIPMFSKIVFLIRNPYDAFITYSNYVLAGHTNTPTKEKFIKKFGSMVGRDITWYMGLVNKIVQNFHGPVHVLQYEKLKTDMANELKKLALFLDVNVTDRDIGCTVKLQEGNFHRNSTKEKYKENFNAVYKTDSLLMVQKTARLAEMQLRDAFGVNVDLGASVDIQLLNGNFSVLKK